MFMYLNYVMCFIWVFINLTKQCSNSGYAFENYLGTVTPYRIVSNKSFDKIEYKGCTPKKIWMLVRHGTRNPSVSSIEKMKSRLPTLRDFIQESDELPNEFIKNRDLDLFTKWKLNLDLKDEKKLTHEGEEEMLSLAERMQSRFPELFDHTYSNTSYKMPFTFTRDQVKVLLQEYEKYPELYNIENPYYKNKTKRQECIENITRVLQLSCDNSITFDEVKKKINGIRTQYFNEIAKQKKSQTSGAGTSDVYKSTWWCFDLLNFLTNSAPTRRGESNLEIRSTQEAATSEAGSEVVEVIYEGPVNELQNINYEDTSSHTSAEDQSRPSTSRSAEPPRKKKKTESQLLMEKATTLLATTMSSVEDHIDAFGQYVTTELRQVKNKKKVSNLKRAIMDLLLQALEEEDENK